MRFIPALLTASALGLGACKDNYDEIGKFTVELNGDNMVFVSVFDKENDYSGIRAMSPGGVKLLLIDGSAGDKDDEYGLPIISMSLQGGVTGGPLDLMFVQVFDESYDTMLTSDGQNGQHRMENLLIGDDGTISFDFSADLERVEAQSEQPVAGAKIAHIEGSFSGTIPASEREDN